MAIKFLDSAPVSKPGRPRTLLSEEDMEAMKARPGQWAQVAKGVTSPGSYQNYRKFGFSVSQRQVGQDRFGTRKFDIYMQWPAPATIEPDYTETITRYTADQNVSITRKSGKIVKVSQWETGVKGSTNRTFSIRTK